MLFVWGASHAQTYTATGDSSKTLNKVDVNPDPNMLNFDAYFMVHAEQLLKPTHALGTIKAQMFIEKDGKISRPVITGHLSPDVDSAVVKTLRSCPPWVPGLKNGVPVRTLVKVSFNFGQMRELKVADPGSHKVTRQDADVPIDEPISAMKPDEGDPNKLYTAVEQLPEYPGGLDALYKFFDDNNKLKGKAPEDRGRELMSFVVERNGSITDVKVMRSIGPEFDTESLRLMKAMPNWKPGIQNGRPVRVQYTVPINFMADNNQ